MSKILSQKSLFWVAITALVLGLIGVTVFYQQTQLDKNPLTDGQLPSYASIEGIEGNWVLEFVESETLTTADPPEEFFMNISKDGSMTGFICNDWVAYLEEDGVTEPGMVTNKECLSPNWLTPLEESVLKSLTEGKVSIINDNEITITSQYSSSTWTRVSPLI